MIKNSNKQFSLSDLNLVGRRQTPALKVVSAAMLTLFWDIIIIISSKNEDHNGEDNYRTGHGGDGEGDRPLPVRLPAQLVHDPVVKSEVNTGVRKKTMIMVATTW